VSPTVKGESNYFEVTVEGEGGGEVFIVVEGPGIAGGKAESRCSVPGSCSIDIPTTNLSTYVSLPGGTYSIKAVTDDHIIFSKSLYLAPPRLSINRFDFTSVENAGGMQIRLRDVVYSATNTGDLPAFFGFQFTYGGTKILWHGNVDKQTLLPKESKTVNLGDITLVSPLFEPGKTYSISVSFIDTEGKQLGSTVVNITIPSTVGYII
jgi:hypothetical protein